MTQILYVITELDVGGAERTLCELVTRLSRGAYEPEVACLMGHGPLANVLEEAHVPVHFLEARGKWDLRALWRLRRLIGRADMVHSFLYHANMAARIAAAGAGAAAVISSARVAERSRPERRRHECRTHWLVDAEVCVSNGVRDYMASGGFPREKLHVVPNGVDAARFARRDPALKSRLGLPPEAPLITTIGRLHEQKGLSTFLRAAASVLHSRPDARFLIVGTGPLEEQLRAEAAQFHIAHAVTFLGFADDVPAVLAAADIFVLASLWEGMPNALLEAQAAGLPTVATRVEGTVDIVEDGRTGLLVIPKDVPGLATAVLRLLEEPGRGRRLGEAARERVRAHFTLDAMVRRHEILYDQLLAERSR